MDVTILHSPIPIPYIFFVVNYILLIFIGWSVHASYPDNHSLPLWYLNRQFR